MKTKIINSVALLFCCLASLLSAEAADNGFQKGAKHYRFGLESYTNNLFSCGVIYDYSATARLDDKQKKEYYNQLGKKYKTVIKSLEKKYKKSDVYVIQAPDGKDFMAIRIPVTQSCYKFGVADEMGQVILEPKYSQCWYCPSLRKETELFTVEVSWKEPEQKESSYVKKDMHLWHDEAQGTFVATEGDKWQIVSFTGTVLAETTEYDLTYYHGYLIFGPEETSREYWPGGIFTEQKGDKVAVRFVGRGEYENKPYHVFTTDGKEVVKGKGWVYIYDLMDGTNAFQYGTRDADNLYRCGVRFLGEQPKQIPPYFSSVKYDSGQGQWLVRPQRLRTFEAYNPQKHNGISYLDEGERLFYVGGKKPANAGHLDNTWFYDECIHYYSQILQKDELAAKPWALYYWVAALNEKLGAEMISNEIDISYLEDLSKEMYDYAQKNLEQMKVSVATCAQTYPQLLPLLDAYDKLDPQQMFADDEVTLRNNLTTRIKLAQQYQQRLEAALLTLDNRISAHKEHKAEIEEASRQMLLEQTQREQEETKELERQRQAVDANFGLQILNMFNQTLQMGMNSGTTTRQRNTFNRSANTGGGTYSSSSDGTTSHTKRTVKKQITCDTCHGSKKCNICKGSGKSKATYKNGGNKPCDACNGSGNCYICDGQGYRIRYETE